jgi:hypothetical protein
MPGETVITDFLIPEPWRQTGLEAIQKRMLQDLISNNEVDINKISNRTPALIAKDMINEYKVKQKSKEAIQKAKDDWRAARYNSIESVIPFDDGTKMQIIRPEDVKTEAGKLLALRDLGQSTVDLKQCIGAGCMNTPDYTGHGPYIEPHTGKPARQVADYKDTHVKRYMDRLEDDKAEIARLIDKDGVAQASVELRIRDPQNLKGDAVAHREFLKDWLQQNDNNTYTNILDLGFSGSGNTKTLLFAKHPDLEKAFNAYFRPVAEKAIQEMKGANNGKILEKFVPQMVQWLNSMGDQLTDVRDLDNLPNVHDLDHESNSIGKLMEKNQHWYISTVEDFFEAMEKEKALPRFFTTDEFALKATERGVDLSAEPARAEGEQPKYPKGATPFEMDMIDYFEPGAIRPGYAGYQRIISFDPKTRSVTVNGVKKDDDGNWVDIPRDRRVHSTWPDERQFKEAMGRPMRGLREHLDELDNLAQQFEPEAEQQLPFNRPEFPEALGQNIRDYLEGNAHNLPEDMIEPYATDMRILMGSEREEARLPNDAHRLIIDRLLNQDEYTADIRDLLNRFQQGNHFLTEAQAENLLNMLISWTERYPLNE